MKRGLSSIVSNDNLDSLYDRLIDLGANGGKLLGAGGGGFFWYMETQTSDQGWLMIFPLRTE